MFIREDFLILSARAFLADQTQVPETHGFYCILLRDGDQLVRRLGYGTDQMQAPERLGEFHHLYTGMTGQLRTRLQRHLVKDCRVSTFRRTLMALDHDGKLEPGRPGLQGCEKRLNDWLQANAVIAFKCCPRADAVVAERELLHRTASPLNITERRKTRFARHLMALRARREGRRPQDPSTAAG